jgi:hypothetical protein
MGWHGSESGKVGVGVSVGSGLSVGSGVLVGAMVAVGPTVPPSRLQPNVARSSNTTRIGLSSWFIGILQRDSKMP